MLPFLKRRNEGAMSMDAEKVERKPDDDAPIYDMLDAVAEDILAAVEKKDKTLLKDALSAFAEHLQDLDQEQDAQPLEG